MYDLTVDPAAISEHLQSFISRAADNLQRDGAIIGLRGGIDSAVVCSLAVRALGPDRVFGLMLPELDSAPESKRLAIQHARSLGIRWKVVGLTKHLALLGAYTKAPLWMLGLRRLRAAEVRRQLAELSRTLPEGETPYSAVMVGTRGLKGPWLNEGVAYHRVKVRSRMVILYYHAELYNLLMLGTDNRTELSIGFFVRWGDSAADIAPLAHLYKTQVRQLAAHLGVPREIIARQPSPDILPGLTDEQAMGLGYDTLDRILVRLHGGVAAEAIADELRVPPARVRYVEMLMRRSEHLRSPALVTED